MGTSTFFFRLRCGFFLTGSAATVVGGTVAAGVTVEGVGGGTCMAGVDGVVLVLREVAVAVVDVVAFSPLPARKASQPVKSRG